MKILYLAHRIPYPPNKGDKIRSFNEIKHLSQKYEIDLACLADNPEDLRYKKNLEKYCNRVFALTFSTTSAKIKGIEGLAKGKSISVGYFYRKKLQQIIDRWITRSHYDAIICFSSPMAEYIFRSKTFKFSNLQAYQPPSLQNSRSLLVMDFCDVDSDKWRQYAQYVKFPLNQIYRLEYRRLLRYEKKVNRHFDCSIFVSVQESELFSSLYPEAKNVSVISNGVDYEYFSPEYLSSTNYPQNSSNLNSSINSGPVLLFAGAMDYFANIDGVSWFCNEIYPLIKGEIPNPHFYIVGSNPHPKVAAMGKRNGIRVTGFVEDIRHYYHVADICVIPLRIARGIQNKVIEAMSMGKPVVTTTTAIQGIQAKPGEHLLVADTPEKFTKAIKLLLDNSGLKKRLGNKARQFVKKEHNWSANVEKIAEIMEMR